MLTIILCMYTRHENKKKYYLLTYKCVNILFLLCIALFCESVHCKDKTLTTFIMQSSQVKSYNAEGLI